MKALILILSDGIKASSKLLRRAGLGLLGFGEQVWIEGEYEGRRHARYTALLAGIITFALTLWATLSHQAYQYSGFSPAAGYAAFLFFEMFWCEIAACVNEYIAAKWREAKDIRR